MPLYIVGTPLGNLGDFSPRAVEVLRACDFIAAEDTRVTMKLLARFAIHTPLVSYHEHNRLRSGAELVERLAAGQKGALVTDAGMPAVSDPGADLTAACAERGIEVLVVPGPCAVSAAVALSGFAAGRFCFEGFLSVTGKNRREHLASLKDERRAMVFYEAPHKLIYTLRDMLAAWGDRRVSVSREMTKLHEQTLRGTLSGALAHFERTPPRGEFTLVIEGAAPPKAAMPEDALAAALRYREEGFSLRDAARKAAEENGVSRRPVYEMLLKSCVENDDKGQ
ncbi:MAG: 16S rRNA (cytidine(1402)-2'-O)-methyltransferase [Oscillospiraceae bacterium]|jgi:16S rRNA (cytidine1402-2'-O)-methyltransferase|nr:16S rRNA (cytidine(1402)-2'-O)-methyltransferase [Oscillospiraceae bacterium]